MGQRDISLNLGQQKSLGKEGKSVAVIKNQPKCGTEMRQNAQNPLQITTHSLAAEAPPQTLMNRAYNVLRDLIFQQMLIAPAPEKVSYTYAKYAGEEAYLTSSQSTY